MQRYFSLLTLVIIAALALAGCSTDDSSPLISDTTIDNTNTERDSRANFVTGIPADAAIDSAFMKLYVAESDSETVDITVHEINAPWEEGFVTYSGLEGNYAASPSTNFSVADTGWVMVDISAAVTGWFDGSLDNYGLLLNQLDTLKEWTEFNSREADSLNPMLLVHYTVNGSAAVDTVMAYADTYVDSVLADQNFGTETDLYTGRGDDSDDGTDNPSLRATAIQFMLDVQPIPSSIGDYVWLDLNEDGLQDEGEPGIEGVDLYLYNCEGTLVATTTTDADGMYLFDTLMAGDYVIEIDVPEDHVLTAADQGADDALDSDFDVDSAKTICFSITEGMDDLNWDAGLVEVPQYVTIGDYVWNDADMNGMQDEAEMGIAGIEVSLYTCTDTMIAVDTTDEMGMYLFDSLMAGDYYLAINVPFGYQISPMDAADDSLDSEFGADATTMCFTVEEGVVDLTWDAGLYEFDGCTYGKGYWKNHLDHTAELLPIWLGDDEGDKSLAVTDAQIAYDVLQQHTYGHPSNGITKLYAHLLTAKLNIANMANPADVYEMIDDVDAFLAEYDYMDWDMLDKDMQKDVLKWKGMFEKYNEGYIGPGHCGDDDHDDDYDDDHGDDDDDDYGDDDEDDDDDEGGDDD